MARVRSSEIRLSLGGKDVSGYVATQVISATYTDQEHGQADSLEVQLEDRDGLWRDAWAPSRGLRMSAALLCRDWYEEGRDLAMDCGTFEVDELAYASGMQGSAVTIKGSSVPVTSSIRWEQRSRAWEHASLRQIAEDIAKRHGLGVIFRGEDQSFARLDQRDETDLQFLLRVADNSGQSLKVASDNLILFSGADYDAGAVLATLRKGDSAIASWSFTAKFTDLAKKTTVVHLDPATAAKVQAEYAPDSEPAVGATQRLTQRVESPAHGLKLAKHKTRQKNKREYEGRVSMLGDPRLRAGGVVALSGFGAFDRKYVIATAAHTWARAAGYALDLTLRTALEY